MFFSSVHKKSDEYLMQLLAEGDQRALNELYRRYNARMYRYFVRMLWNDEEKARDFLQDIFLRIIERPEQFDTTRKFSTWFFSVANNMCKNEYRRHAFRAAYARKSVGVVPLNSPDEDDRLPLLHRVVDQLSEEDRNLYALRFEADTALEEIALLLDCPEGTVKSRIFYLKKKIAEALKADEIKNIKYGNFK